MDMERSTERMLARCVREAERLADLMGEHPRCRHISFIFDGQRMVASASNSGKTHPANLGYAYINREMRPIAEFVGTHSEMRAALRLGMDRCEGLTLVNVRIDRKGRVANSRPCGGCRDMIGRAGFAEVYYTVDGGGFAREPARTTWRANDSATPCFFPPKVRT